MKNLLKNTKTFIKNNRFEFIVLLLILLVGAFLRLYKINQYMTFLGDEGRDVIVVRNLLVHADPILIGPGTSIGNMYLGPIYYYMMAPALFLAGYSPVGPAVMIALLGIATVFLVWFIARDWFGKWAAVFASFLYAISPTVIIYSRSSWNPNIMPFFALLVIYSVWKLWKKRSFSWIVVLGLSFAFVLQSHYIALLLVPTIGLFWLITLIQVKRGGNKKEMKLFTKDTIIGGVLFLLLMSPLFIFDARHGYQNFNAMKKFFTERQTTVSARPWNALPSIYPNIEKITTRLVAGRDAVLGKWVGLAFVIGTLMSIFFLVKGKIEKRRRDAFLLIFTWLLFALVGFGVYKQEIYDHYYGFIFAAPFLLFGGFIQEIFEREKFRGVLFGVGISLLIIFADVTNSPLKDTPNNQLKRSVDVAKKIEEESGGARFNLAVIADRNYEDAYKYFLLRDGASVVDIDPQMADATITDQLYVVCELPEEKCQPVTNSKAQVANFGWSKVEKVWIVDGTIVYKLTHTQ